VFFRKKYKKFEGKPFFCWLKVAFLINNLRYLPKYVLTNRVFGSCVLFALAFLT
jgi:hypothetical protein